MGLAGEGVTYAGSPGDPTRQAGWQGEHTALTLAMPHCLTLLEGGPWLEVLCSGSQEQGGQEEPMCSWGAASGLRSSTIFEVLPLPASTVSVNLSFSVSTSLCL